MTNKIYQGYPHCDWCARYRSQDTAKIFRRPMNHWFDRMPTNHGSLRNSANFAQRHGYLTFRHYLIINIRSFNKYNIQTIWKREIQNIKDCNEYLQSRPRVRVRFLTYRCNRVSHTRKMDRFYLYKRFHQLWPKFL